MKKTIFLIAGVLLLIQAGCAIYPAPPPRRPVPPPHPRPPVVAPVPLPPPGPPAKVIVIP